MRERNGENLGETERMREGKREILWKLRYSVKDPKDRERATTIAIVIVGKKRDDIKNKAKKDNNSIRSKRKIIYLNLQLVKILLVLQIAK